MSKGIFKVKPEIEKLVNEFNRLADKAEDSEDLSNPRMEVAPANMIRLSFTEVFQNFHIYMTSEDAKKELEELKNALKEESII